MPIHLPTLALVLVFLMVLAASTLLFLALGHPGERGIRHAGFAILTQTLGAMLILVLRQHPPMPLLIGLGIALLLGGAWYLLIAVRLFYGRRVPFWQPLAGGLVILIVFLQVVTLEEKAQTRMALVSPLLGLTALALAREFVRKTREEVWAGPRWLCAMAFLLFGVTALGQSIRQYRMPAHSTPVEVIPASLGLLLAALALYACLGLGLALVLAQRLEARQQRFAQSDLLTGLLNYRGFEVYAERVLDRAHRKGQFTSLLLLEVDHFEHINDAYGRGAGDLVLESLGDLLHAQLRERDGAGRQGGEELVVLLPETHQSFAAPIAERIRRAVETLVIVWEGQTIPVTVSVGVASTDEADSQLTALVALADSRLRRAKAEGRNRVVAA